MREKAESFAVNYLKFSLTTLSCYKMLRIFINKHRNFEFRMMKILQKIV